MVSFLVYFILGILGLLRGDTRGKGSCGLPGQKNLSCPIRETFWVCDRCHVVIMIVATVLIILHIVIVIMVMIIPLLQSLLLSLLLPFIIVLYILCYYYFSSNANGMRKTKKFSHLHADENAQGTKELAVLQGDRRP